MALAHPEVTFPVIEIFGPTVQGEGSMCGRLTHFIRLGGCGHRCTWCDTMYAVDPDQVKANSTMMTSKDIVRKILELPKVSWITLSGGDPCIHKHFGRVISELRSHGYNIALETQGSIHARWITTCDHVTLSPKGPGSGMEDKLGEFIAICQDLHGAGVDTAIKVVITWSTMNEDIDFAMRIFREAQITIPGAKLYLQACSPTHSEIAHGETKRHVIIHRYQELCTNVFRMLAQKHITLPTTNFSILPQMHAVIWPNIDRGI